MSLSINSFPRAILHIDGDSFFASCEIAVNPNLRGKYVVTGLERGIASSMTYNLKDLGVKRGMTLSEIKKICPATIFLPSDYETYSLFSKRMYDIVRRYTPDIEEYSIDECFADLTGLRRVNKMSYEKMAECIKHDLDTELGITFSIGLGPNKVVAKIGSKWKKPSGLTIIPANKLELYLSKLKVDKIWGIGTQTSALLNKYGVNTALDFAQKNEEWLNGKMSKPYKEIWRELRGEFVLPLNIEEKHDYQSISKTKTFTPPSNDKDFVFSQLSKNIENACIKARRHNLAPKKIFFFLKTQDFKYSEMEIKLNSPTSTPNELIRIAKNLFPRIFKKGILYRATGATLLELEESREKQLDLFGAVSAENDWQAVYEAVDSIDSKFGKHTIYLGSTYRALHEPSCQNDRNTKHERELFMGENGRQKIGVPMLGVVK